MERYFTIAQEERTQIKVKDSKFIATVAPVANESEAEAFITKVSKEFYDASHNVSAFKIGIGDVGVKRYNDDGEPAGSSGPPVLQVIEGANLTNVVLVITRYFGGTKLGYGGLIRAYSDAAQAGLRKAKILKKVRYILLRVAVPYDQMGSVIKEVQSGIGEIKETQYSNDGVIVFVDLLPTYLDRFRKRIIDATRGRAEIVIENERFRVLESS